eukprot:TRINITY_DN14627_c0_g1_i1.p1 TRINITY_DN14627_c0_g1~~TRINITY_DN14627_c0_g1_i1.p1  ORF type:complete len:474 (-),score=127.41 TRINITY_DN14627_c0_g1_i1:305-1726(-)
MALNKLRPIRLQASLLYRGGSSHQPFRHVQAMAQGSHCQTSSVESLDFSDHKTVFKFKSTFDLLRSLSILRICSINMFVDNALPMMRWAEAILGNKIFSAIARPTFYRQFVGGDTEEELSKTCELMRSSGLRLMVCPAMEEDEGEGSGEEKYDFNTKYISEIGDMMVRAGAEKPCLQFKITAMMPADVVTKISGMVGKEYTMQQLAELVHRKISNEETISLPELSLQENTQLNLGVERLAGFGKAGVDKDLRLLVDAEYTYMNQGISVMALGMMLAFNKMKPVVWNTYQCYLKQALNTVSTEQQLVTSLGCCFGAKIVRGAYMEKERKLAKMKGYEDPVNDTYEETGEMYNRVVDYLLNHISTVGDRCNIVCGTHNEAGAIHVATTLTNLGIDPGSGQVVFGQIYGMADQISVPLASAGFTVYKSVPYGPLGEVLPYLSRRAAENRVVLAGARREQELLRKEIKRRRKEVLAI